MFLVGGKLLQGGAACGTKSSFLESHNNKAASTHATVKVTKLLNSLILWLLRCYNRKQSFKLLSFSVRLDQLCSTLSAAEALPLLRRKNKGRTKSTRKETSGASPTKRAVLSRKAAVLDMCNKNNGLKSKRRILAAMHMVKVLSWRSS